MMVDMQPDLTDGLTEMVATPKYLYHQLINLPNVARFDETIAAMRSEGPVGPLPSHFEPKIPTPKGPIDKW